jgi:hypothetical protein
VPDASSTGVAATGAVVTGVAVKGWFVGKAVGKGLDGGKVGYLVGDAVMGTTIACTWAEVVG